MTRNDERLVRSQEEPIVGGLPDVPGILAAIRLTPGPRRPPARPRRRTPRQRLPGRHDQPWRARDPGDRRLGGQRLLLLHGLARCVRDGGAGTDGATGARAARRRGQGRIVRRASAPRCGPSSTSPGPSAARPRELTAGRRRGRAAARARPTPTSSSPCSSRLPSRCTTGWSRGFARRPRRRPRPTVPAPPRSPHTATAISGSRPFPAEARGGDQPSRWAWRPSDQRAAGLSRAADHLVGRGARPAGSSRERTTGGARRSPGRGPAAGRRG